MVDCQCVTGAERMDDTKLSYLHIKSLKPRDVYEAVCRIRQRKLPDLRIVGNVGSFLRIP